MENGKGRIKPIFFFFLMASDNSVTPVLSAAFARSFLS